MVCEKSNRGCLHENNEEYQLSYKAVGSVPYLMSPQVAEDIFYL